MTDVIGTRPSSPVVRCSQRASCAYVMAYSRISTTAPVTTSPLPPLSTWCSNGSGSSARTWTAHGSSGTTSMQRRIATAATRWRARAVAPPPSHALSQLIQASLPAQARRAAASGGGTATRRRRARIRGRSRAITHPALSFYDRFQRDVGLCGYHHAFWFCIRIISCQLDLSRQQ